MRFLPSTAPRRLTHVRAVLPLLLIGVAVAGEAPAIAAWTSPHDFIIAPGADEAVHATARGIAAGRVGVVWEVAELDGRVVRAQRQELTAGGDGALALDWTVPGSDMEMGERDLRVRLERAGAVLAQARRPLICAGPQDLFIVFEPTPIARGLEVVPKATQTVEVEVGGVKRTVMRAGFGSAPEGWWHSLLVDIADARFQAGKRPVVDLALTFHHPANAPVQLFADTARGGVQIAGGWGGNPGWQTMNVALDDARFARTVLKAPEKEMRPDGCDLRFNACTGDAEVRSLFIRGYDREHDPDYRRLLRCDGLDAGRDRFVFAPGEKPALALGLRNLATRPLAAAYTLRLADDAGHEMWRRDASALIGADGPSRLPVPFDTAGLPQGVYMLSLDLGRDGAQPRAPLAQSTVALAVAEQSPLARAAPGEFRYGLDVGADWRDERFYAWADFMGVDIVRFPGTDDLAQLPEAFAALDRHHLTTGMMFSPPWDPDPNRRQARVAEVAAHAGEVAKRFAGRLHYYELGNEPDLTFFYAGPMDAYLAGMAEIARAVKAADPDSCVMNGGLCFFAGDPRAARFYEALPAGLLDAVAYHGHGPLVGAERAAFERNRAEAARHGRAYRLVETESGVAARTPAQLRIQARTAVEKLVFAQSTGMPLFYFFRLFITGGDGDYTCLVDAQQPRPVVLAYRTMVKTLRGLRFDRSVDLGPGGGEAYLFRAARGGARALVAWTDAGAGTRTLALAGTAGAVADARRIDLFGNERALPEARGGHLALTVGPDPVFVAWTCADEAFAVHAEPAPLALPSTVHLVAGGPDHVRVTVRNPAATALAAEIAVVAGGAAPGRAGAQVDPAAAANAATPGAVSGEPVAIQVPAGGERAIDLPVAVAAGTRTFAWPMRWTLAIDPPDDHGARSGDQVDAGGRGVDLVDGGFDLAALAGGHRERRAALLTCVIDSAEARTVRVGASADWWMAWTVDGTPVFDTLATGNAGGFAITDHVFDLPLHRGRNRVAVRVLSGSAGWRLLCGGPDELAQAGGTGAQLAVELRSGGAVLARAVAPIAWLRPLAPPPGAWNGDLAPWTDAAPAGAIGDGAIVNDFSRQPDSAKWWHGPADCSARLWLRADAQHLVIAAAVRDDVHHPAASPAAIDTGDALAIAIAGPDGAVTRFGVTGTGALCRCGAGGAWSAAPADGAAVVARDDASGTTWYRIALERRALPGTRLALDVEVRDDDFGGLKQRAAWHPGFAEAAPATAAWEPILLGGQ